MKWRSRKPTERNQNERPVLPFRNRSSADLLPIWYKKTPVGKITIDTIMKKMKEISPLKDVYSEAVTNHSAKETMVKKEFR
jgi:hypothetical protein